jgi:hypothetical protein
MSDQESSTSEFALNTFWNWLVQFKLPHEHYPGTEGDLVETLRDLHDPGSASPPTSSQERVRRRVRQSLESMLAERQFYSNHSSLSEENLTNSEIKEDDSHLHSAHAVDGVNSELVIRLGNEFLRSQSGDANQPVVGGQTRQKLINKPSAAIENSPAQSKAESLNARGGVFSRLLGSSSIPMATLETPRHDSWSGFVYRAIAAMAIVAIVLGYFALEPPRFGNDQPKAVPAGVYQFATPDQVIPSTPTALADHSIIGIWLVDDTAFPGADITVFSFNKYGQFSNIDNQNLLHVVMGEWQQTGEQTIELVAIEQSLNLHPIWDTGPVPTPYVLDTIVQLWRLSITVDETGNSFTATGGYSIYASDGSIIKTEDGFKFIGSRLEVIAVGTEGTPIP